MKTIAFAAGLLLAASTAHAQQWDSSPLNYNNSEMNYDNSPLNYNNSPLNYNNSPMNGQSSRGIYDNSGNRLGYGVYRPDGGMNFFDNGGNRLGYRPGR